MKRNESGNSDSDKEGVEELPQRDSTHVNNVNEKRQNINLQNNVQR